MISVSVPSFTVRQCFQCLSHISTSPADVLYYYALNKMLNSDWLNTDLTLVDVWLGGSNVRQRNLVSGQLRCHSCDQCYTISNAMLGW